MKKGKKFIGLLVTFVLLLMQATVVMAEEKEWYELKEKPLDEIVITNEDFNSEVEITPYTRYIMNVTLTLAKLSSSSLNMRSEVFCIESVSKITTTFDLQKKSGSKWVSVGTGSVSQSNSDHMYKSMTASGVSSGTYRCVATTTVTGKTGYTETVSGISGTITL